MFKVKSRNLLLLSAFYFSTVLNITFWKFFLTKHQLDTLSDYLFMLMAPLIIFTVTYIVFNVFVVPRLEKVILTFLLISASIVSYVMYSFGTIIDSEMVRNAAITHTQEVLDLVTWRSFLWVFFCGILPSIILFRITIIREKLSKELLNRTVSIVVSVFLVLIFAGVSYKEGASFGRNNLGVARLILPFNYLGATFKYIKKSKFTDTTFKIVDADIKAVPTKHEKPTVFFIVLGETARANNFSLDSYQKITNPKLAQQNIINFNNVSSCGTATAISLPCIFSSLERKNFDVDAANYQENLLDLLQKVGYQVYWLDNNDGCKGVCKRINNLEINKKSVHCNAPKCHDDVLLDGLEDFLNNVTQNTVVVLHMIGSHGPTYYERYPDEFKQFTPTCDTAEIQSCTQEKIVNTYDNTILYTDHVVSSVIDRLKEFPQFETGLLFVSDHGESLGENNIYLHGLPYSIAPKYQTHIPMFLWFSPMMKESNFLDTDCLHKNATTQAFSHDNIYHSILSLLQVQSKTYQPQLDLFAPCRVNNYLHPQVKSNP